MVPLFHCRLWVLAIGPCTKLRESSPHQHMLPIEGPFNIILLYMPTSAKQSLYYPVFQLKFCMHLLCPPCVLYDLPLSSFFI
jgi:hypothetical protein